MHQQWNILPSFTNGRQLDTNDVQSMKQVFPKTAFTNAFFQVLMRCSDNSNINAHRRVTTHPVEFPVGQHTQKTRLHFCRHVTNFIQKQGACIGLLKAPYALILCPCKCTALMAKQF